MPAIHLKREIVGKLFEEKLGSEKDNFDPTYLTRQARRALRQDFLNADAGMTGGNFAVASTGEVVVLYERRKCRYGNVVPEAQYLRVRD